MKISVSRKIILEELPSEVRGWFQKVTTVLNPYLDVTYQALNRGLTVADNFKAQSYTQTLQPGQTKLKLAYRLNERPIEVRIAQLIASDGTVPTSAPYCHWQYVNETIEATIVGLDSLKKYSITLIAQV